MSDIITNDGLGPFDPYWTDDVPPPRRSRRGWRGRIFLGVTAAAGLVGAALYLSAPSQEPTVPPSLGGAAALSETVDPNLAPLFTFDAGEGRQAEYEARIVAATGGRRDLYSVGVLGGDAPALRLEVQTRAKAAPSSSLFVEVAEQAAAFGAAVERLEVSHNLATAQGPVEWSELTLAGLQRSCAGFRLLGRGDIGLRGLACAAPGAKLDAAALSCLIDRIALTQAGRDAGLGGLLKGPDARRPGCRVVVGSR
jgi:hypothetical protein